MEPKVSPQGESQNRATKQMTRDAKGVDRNHHQCHEGVKTPGDNQNDWQPNRRTLRSADQDLVTREVSRPARRHRSVPVHPIHRIGRPINTKEKIKDKKDETKEKKQITRPPVKPKYADPKVLTN